MRTEAHPGGFPEGHNHGHAGDINYARAEIGRNTDIDSSNRFEPKNISDSDYFSIPDPEAVLVFGDVWHRTPHLKENEARLYILIELQRLR